jgi:hypothetical protein
MTESAYVSERNIRDVILGRRVLTGLDQNTDTKLDVADLVKFLRTEQSSQGMKYVGTMAFDNATALAAQEIEIVIPATAPGGTFEATVAAGGQYDDSPLFSGPFTMQGTLSADGVPSFTSSGTGSFPPNGSNPRNPLVNNALSWELSVSNTQLNEGNLEARFVMTYSGLKAGMRTFQLHGKLYLVKQLPNDTLMFDYGNDLKKYLVDRYGL